MQSVTVTTKAELEAAKNAKVSEIVVVGKLANDLKKAKKVMTLGAIGLMVLTGAIGLAPFTGGVSLGVAATAAALTGLEISAIIIASAIGLSLVLAVFKGYEEVGYSDGNMRLKRSK